jgi:hypothetical protein
MDDLLDFIAAYFPFILKIFVQILTPYRYLVSILRPFDELLLL